MSSVVTTSFLRNKYWVLRHGKSIPNERGLIVSSLENGLLEEYQLASDGVIQAQNAGELFHKELEDAGIPLENVRICYSPFARTTHTARTVASVLNLPFDSPQCKVIEDLRERYFGPTYELQSHERYPEIWALDEKDPFQKPEEGGESASDVVSRLIRAMELMETDFEGCGILVVSHGDPLQMLQNILNVAKESSGSGCNSLAQRLEAVKVPSVLSKHRRFSLETGELRAVNRAQPIMNFICSPNE
ncbi:hypothetical protein V2J09_021014 [Rumex salicifolius]